VNAIVCIQFFLELDNCFITLVETGGQRDHDVSLFQQQLLVSVDLGLVFFDLNTLALNLAKFCIVFLPDLLLLLLKRNSKLLCLFNLLSSSEHLPVQRFDLVF